MARGYCWLVSRLRSERGQGTVEYVLVMLAVTAIAVILITWARSGSGKSVLGNLFDEIIGWVTGAAGKFKF